MDLSWLSWHYRTRFNLWYKVKLINNNDYNLTAQLKGYFETEIASKFHKQLQRKGK